MFLIFLIIFGYFGFKVFKTYLKEIAETKEYRKIMSKREAEIKVINTRTKKDKINMAITIISLLILVVAFPKKEGIEKEKPAKEIETKDTSTTENNAETTKNIEDNVKIQKTRIRVEFLKYEKEHLDLWNSMTNAIQKSDVYTAYEYAEKSKNTIFEIRGNLRNLKCNKTGDSEFDKQCEETITLGKNAYSAKQEAVNKLLKWFDDLQSPKKANEAKKSLEEGGEYWQVFLLKLTALTLTDEDLKDSKTKK
ncbi:hypothetical protein JCM16776_0718 [Leptotrichia shahii]|uniref:Uncharacterized protein n=1 Tax=Leptotrichia shahii TaxID=157691 RepID=A0A510JMH3_9FUSO|nr:hypothetical protein [Leptotrichia shahii]BBM40498.1 hypothetical protein JCM16776_0718 [Leptotrichia shahii]